MSCARSTTSTGAPAPCATSRGPTATSSGSCAASATCSSAPGRDRCRARTSSPSGSSDDRPAQRETTLVHGDFRLGNVLALPGPHRVSRACSTGSSRRSAIRSPTSATSSRRGASPASRGNALELSPVTRATGFPTRDELVARYAARSGRDVTDVALVHGARALEGRDLPRGQLPAPARRQHGRPVLPRPGARESRRCWRRPGSSCGKHPVVPRPPSEPAAVAA